jgi:hypothetical protein
MSAKKVKISKFKEANTVIVKDHNGVEHRVWKGEADIIQKHFDKKAKAKKSIAKKTSEK